MSTRYAILDNVDEKNSFVFDTNKAEEEMEKIVDSYADGTGNNFQFDGNYFKDPTTIENDFMVVKQMTVENSDFYVLYQLIYNYNEESRKDLLDYNFNLSDEVISNVVDEAFGIIRDEMTSIPVSFDYDFKFCEGDSI